MKLCRSCRTSFELRVENRWALKASSFQISCSTKSSPRPRFCLCKNTTSSIHSCLACDLCHIVRLVLCLVLPFSATCVLLEACSSPTLRSFTASCFKLRASQDNLRGHHVVALCAAKIFLREGLHIITMAQASH